MQNNKRLFVILIVASLLLAIPLIAMAFTYSVNWSPFDFAVAGIFLFSFGFILEFILRKTNKTKHRVGWSLILALFLLLIWVELSVGIFGSPLAGN